MAELQMLLSEEIPNGRKSLLDSHNNLQRVASYCTQKYSEEADKKSALEETKNYTTQSLASVAYQINTLASNMLQMLDIQAAQLSNMDSAINNISQTVDIHKEKIARREIGLLTTSKVTTRAHQIVAPTNPERPVKYVRKPVDFSELDDIGHGVKINAQPNTGTARRSSAAGVKKSPASSTDGGSKRDSLKSTVSGYGTLRAVKAPTVPPDYSQSSSGMPPPPPMVAGSGMPPPPPVVSDDFPPPMSPVIPPPPPPVGSMGFPPPVLPPSDSNGGYSIPVVGVDGKAPTVGGSAQTYATTAVADLPPPPPSNMLSAQSHPSGVASRNPSLPMTGFTARMTGADMGIPPLPPSLGANVSPSSPMGNDVLPPPPPSMGSGGLSPMDGVIMEPDWAPKTYLEKMVIIYDYSAENADELNLKEDQMVYVVRKNDDGWFEGVVDGVTGLFPGNYAESVSS